MNDFNIGPLFVVLSCLGIFIFFGLISEFNKDFKEVEERKKREEVVQSEVSEEMAAVRQVMTSCLRNGNIMTDFNSVQTFGGKAVYTDNNRVLEGNIVSHCLRDMNLKYDYMVYWKQKESRFSEEFLVPTYKNFELEAFARFGVVEND